MIELKGNKLETSFPELRLNPTVTIDFQRTLRIPDDGKNYPLPPGLGSFPLRHIDDFSEKVPASWLKRGGVLLPMWQTEALWLSFHSDYVPDRHAPYPFAIKVATGKISAITGEGWRAGLSRNPQNYLVVPQQPWLDGYCVEKGIIRQFVAMPLGKGFSVEEQLTGEAEFGGIQLEIFPMRAEVFEKRFPVRPLLRRTKTSMYGLCDMPMVLHAPTTMGLAPGGRMRQEIYTDPYSIHDWDTAKASRCFVHLVNSAQWREITGEVPPTQPPCPADYTAAGYPWFDYYDEELKAMEGSSQLAGVKSVAEKMAQDGPVRLAANETVGVTHIVGLRPRKNPNQVREAEF